MAYTPPFADRYDGTALASRWPHEVVEVMDLRLTDAPDVPWCTLAAIVELPVGADIDESGSRIGPYVGTGPATVHRSPFCHGQCAG